MTGMEEINRVDIKHPEHVCAKCDDSLQPSAALPAIRLIRTELNATLDDLERKIVAQQERRLDGK